MLNTMVLNGGAFAGGAPVGLTFQQNHHAVSPKVDSVDAQLEMGARGTCTFILVNPPALPVIGDLIEVRWQSERLFAGILHELRQEDDPTHRVRQYHCEAADWELSLERRLLTESFAFQPPDQIIEEVIRDLLAGEDILHGTIDTGPSLVEAKGENMRCAEFLHDVAASVGAVLYVDPDHFLHLRRTTFLTGPFILSDAQIQAAETFEVQTDKELYRNSVTVTAKGGNTSVTVTRKSDSEITDRKAKEGGTGIYERAESIDHPTLTDIIGLTRFAISYALIRLQAVVKPLRTIKCTTREPHLKLGQQITVDLPSYGLAGTWIIHRVQYRDEDGRRLITSIEAVETGRIDQGLEAFLRLVDAGRATITLPVQDYQNLETFTAIGVFSFTIPGSGGVEVEITIFAPGGGGGGASYINQLGDPNPPCTGDINTGSAGGPGGNGGKVIAWRNYPAGTELTVTIQGAGAKGLVGWSASMQGTCSPASTDGGDAGFAKVELSGALIGRADGGKGGKRGTDFTPFPGKAGAWGGGEGDFVVTGGGRTGGGGGTINTPGFNGLDGAGAIVEIRY